MKRVEGSGEFNKLNFALICYLVIYQPEMLIHLMQHISTREPVILMQSLPHLIQALLGRLLCFIGDVGVLGSAVVRLMLGKGIFVD